MQDVPDRVYGVDFSGAQDAGKRIWIASGTAEGDALRIDECRRGDDLPGSGKSRDACLTALRKLIRSRKASAFGLDFPFGLPRPLVRQTGWDAFVLSFPSEYPNPDRFRRTCREAAGGRELKRATDREARTPFSAYNLRLYRQTYYGIRDVLHPLVRDRQACVLPMQKTAADRPWILEICPASTLKQAGLYMPYKGRTEEHRTARASILEHLECTGALSVPASSLRSKLLDDRGGDALDSVIGALATFRALCSPDLLAVGHESPYGVEGFVYV
jgi:hypothetical protein